MIQLTFSLAEIQALTHERFTHSHPLVRRKMEALLLKSENLPTAVIARLCGICGNTLRNYLAGLPPRRSGQAQRTAFLPADQSVWPNTAN